MGDLTAQLERILSVKRELESACGFRELTGAVGHMALRSGASNRVEAGCASVHARCIVQQPSGQMLWYIYPDSASQDTSSFSLRVQDDGQCSSQELAWRINRAARAVRTVVPGGLLQLGVQNFAHLLRERGVGSYGADAFARMIFEHSSSEQARAIAYAISDLGAAGVQAEISVQPDRSLSVRMWSGTGAFETMTDGTPKSSGAQRDPRTMRQELENALRDGGYLMEYDAGAVPGENHLLVRASDGQAVDAQDPSVPAWAIDMARRWGELTDKIEQQNAPVPSC